MQIVTSITDPEQQVRALAEVTGAAARAGQVDRATQIATTITDPTRRAQALADMAHGAPATAAGRLLGAAFAVGPWYVPLAELARRQPEAIPALLDDVCDSLGL